MGQLLHTPETLHPALRSGACCGTAFCAPPRCQVIGWGQIGYGAALSAIAAAVLLTAVTRGRQLAVIATGTLAAAAGPVLWNGILRAANGVGFFVDAPVAVFPVSWQDTGSGVFAFATAALLLGIAPPRTEPSRRTITYAVLAGLAALVVDVYLY